MRLTEKVRIELEQLIQPGDICVDATAGNGHDTLTMATLVAPSGQVIAVDIQADAIASTRERIEAAKLGACCQYRQGDHAQILHELLDDYSGRVRAITFNLGYLPGSDKIHITKPETTLAAIKISRELLSDHGALFIVAYRGHSGGLAEADTVEQAMMALPSKDWTIDNFEPEVRDPKRIPPTLWIARRQAV